MKHTFLLILLLTVSTGVFASNTTDSIPSWAEPFLSQHQKDFLLELSSKCAGFGYSALQDIIADKELRDNYLTQLEEDYKAGKLQLDKDKSFTTFRVKHDVEPLAVLDSCKFATFVVYEPYTGDDLQIRFDLVYRIYDDGVSVVNNSIRFTGMCAQYANFECFDGKPVTVKEFMPTRSLECYLSGILTFKDSKRNVIKIHVGRQFRIKMDDL